MHFAMQDSGSSKATLLERVGTRPARMGPPLVCVRFAAILLILIAPAPVVRAQSPTGDLDPSFDGDGLVATDFPGFALEHAAALVLQTDGKLVAAGSVGFVGSNSQFGLARYDTDGSLDSTFDADGLVSTDFQISGTAYASALVLQP